jgi:hypothetical protein
MNCLCPSKRSAWLLAMLVCAGSAFASAPASAGPIPFGQFLEFGFTDVGTPATGCFSEDPNGPFCTPSFGTPTSNLDAPPWTFTAPSGGVELTVTDAFDAGDRFQIFDFGVSLGLTSLPFSASSGVDCGDDPVTCLATAGISQGQFFLAAGNHSLMLVPTMTAGFGGAGYLRADVVPEPTTMVLVGSGFALTIFKRARTRRSRV